MNASMLKVHPKTGEIKGKVSLRTFADTDGSPEMSWVRMNNGRVLCLLQRLNINNAYRPTDYSLMASIDPATDDTFTIRLARTNRVTQIKADDSGFLYVGEAGLTGRFSRLDGGIERFDPATMESKGLVVEESELGGDIVDFEIVNDSLGFVIVGSEKTSIVAFDPSIGKKLGTVLGKESFAFQQLLYDRERKLMYVLDKDARRPAIRVFEIPAFKEREEWRWEFRLSPTFIALMEG